MWPAPDRPRYWLGRLVCRTTGMHNGSCRGRSDCARTLDGRTVFARAVQLDGWLHDHHLRWLAQRTTGWWTVRRVQRRVAERIRHRVANL